MPEIKLELRSRKLFTGEAVNHPIDTHHGPVTNPGCKSNRPLY
jgi:hypothetical protein